MLHLVQSILAVGMSVSRGAKDSIMKKIWIDIRLRWSRLHNFLNMNVKKVRHWSSMILRKLTLNSWRCSQSKQDFNFGLRDQCSDITGVWLEVGTNQESECSKRGWLCSCALTFFIQGHLRSSRSWIFHFTAHRAKEMFKHDCSQKTFIGLACRQIEMDISLSGHTSYYKRCWSSFIYIDHQIWLWCA